MSRDTAYEEKYAGRLLHAAVTTAAEQLGAAWETASLEERRRAVACAFIEWMASTSFGGQDGYVVLRIVKRVAETIAAAPVLEVVRESGVVLATRWWEEREP